MSEQYEDYISIESGCDGVAPEMISSFPVHWRWSDHNAAAQYLEVQTVDGWQAVYPLIVNKNKRGLNDSRSYEQPKKEIEDE